MTTTAPLDTAPPAPRLPVGVEALDVWRATELGHAEIETVSTGYALLDAELPAAGWPRGAVTELLQPQPSIAEWRLLLPALAPLASARRPILAIGPPHHPYTAGLRRYGVPERHLVMVRTDTPARRLWAAEQAARAGGLAAVIAWLPNVRPAQMRRLQVLAAQWRRSPREEHARYQQRLREYNCGFVADIHNAATAAQREHAARKLQAYEADLRALAAGAFPG